MIGRAKFLAMAAFNIPTAVDCRKSIASHVSVTSGASLEGKADKPNILANGDCTGAVQGKASRTLEPAMAHTAVNP